MQSDAVANRYAQALLDLGDAHKKVDTFAENLEAFVELYTQSNELRIVLNNPGIPVDERKAVVAAITKRLSADTLLTNFLKLLVDRGRTGVLPRIRRAYQRLADKRSGRVRGTAVSARPLNKIQVKQLQQAAEKMLGQDVVLEERVDESLIGGVRLEIQGQVYDGSVRGHLNRIREQLSGH